MTTASPKIDGELSEDDWPRRALRRQFLGSDGQLARPYSEVRFLHDDHWLYAALYAADEDIHSSEAFELTLGVQTLHVDATGKVSDPAVRAAVDRDGTLDDSHDDDEEWVIELAIPVGNTGMRAGVMTGVRAARCDTPKDGIERCGQWQGNLTLQ